MSDNQRNGVSTADLLGPVVFMGASVIGVSVVIALLRGVPDEGASGIGALARSVVLSFGYAPALLFALGGAYVGARIFLKGEFQSAGRDLSGLVGTSAGLAILLGTLSETAGGGFGGAVGGFLSTYLTRVFGGIVGLAAFLAPIWLTWLQEGARSGRKSAQEDRLSVARGLGVGTASEVDAEDLASGVSAEEANALLPDSAKVAADEATALAKPDYEEVLARGVPAWALKNESSNPYPEDPRRVGAVPPGAKPLEDNDAKAGTGSQKSEAGSDASTVQRWTPSRGAEALDAADDDLATDEAGEQGVVEPSLREPAATGGKPKTELESAAKLVEPVKAPAEAKPKPPAASSRGGIEVLAVETSAPRPSWETAGQEDEGEEESKPEGRSASTLWRPNSAKTEQEQASVADDDAETTDEETRAEVLSVAPEQSDADEEWEARAVADEVEDAEEAADEDDQAALAEVEEDDEEVEVLQAAEDDDEYEYVEVEEGDDEEDVEAAEDDDEYEYVEVDEDEEDVEASGDDDDEYEYIEVEEDEEDEDVEADDNEDDDEYEYVEVEVGDEEEDDLEAAEDDDEYEYVEVDEDEDEDDEGEVAADDDDEEYEYVEVEDDEDEESLEAADEATEDEDEDVTDPVEIAASAESDPEPKAESRPKAEPAVESEDDDNNGETQMDLFTPPKEPVAAKAAVTPAESENHSDEESGEEIVVIQPQPSPALVATMEARQAAELILSESRVAVSLLQRKIGLDFKQSCVVLDELQELGFIGPYIDGKQRDILMDREEWLCAVGAE